ncbi:MAG: Arc family DNA-binding protein [Polaromonas sp.]
MPTTLTLKNIPDELYGRLKDAAEVHRRSLNSEVIVCLESILLPQKISVEERLARARQLRKALPSGAFEANDIAHLREEGRP